jgi:hypothetical protein
MATDVETSPWAKDTAGALFRNEASAPPVVRFCGCGCAGGDVETRKTHLRKAAHMKRPQKNQAQAMSIEEGVQSNSPSACHVQASHRTPLPGSVRWRAPSKWTH